VTALATPRDEARLSETGCRAKSLTWDVARVVVVALTLLDLIVLGVGFGDVVGVERAAPTLILSRALVVCAATLLLGLSSIYVDRRVAPVRPWTPRRRTRSKESSTSNATRGVLAFAVFLWWALTTCVLTVVVVANLGDVVVVDFDVRPASDADRRPLLVFVVAATATAALLTLAFLSLEDLRRRRRTHPVVRTAAAPSPKTDDAQLRASRRS